MKLDNLIAEITLTTGIEKLKVKTILESFREQLKDSLEENSEIYIPGLGQLVNLKLSEEKEGEFLKNQSIKLKDNNSLIFEHYSEYTKEISYEV